VTRNGHLVEGVKNPHLISGYRTAHFVLHPLKPHTAYRVHIVATNKGGTTMTRTKRVKTKS
jgi:hypothetical protein